MKAKLLTAQALPLLILAMFSLRTHADEASDHVAEAQARQSTALRQFKLVATPPEDVDNIGRNYFAELNEYALREFDKLDCFLDLQQLVSFRNAGGSNSSGFETAKRIQLKRENLDETSNSFLIRRKHLQPGLLLLTKDKHTSDVIRIGIVEEADEGRRAIRFQMDVRFGIAQTKGENFLWAPLFKTPPELIFRTSIYDGSKSSTFIRNFIITISCKRSEKARYQQEQNYLDLNKFSDSHSTLDP